MDADHANAEPDSDEVVIELSLYRKTRERSALESRRSHPSYPGDRTPRAWRNPSDSELRADTRWGTSAS